MAGRWASSRIAALAAAAACIALPVAAVAQPVHLAPGEVARGAVEPEPPDIDLLTFGVGARIFEKFGHSAICLHYHRPEHRDVCFNYGVTDFSAGAIMIWRFLRGEQRFWVEPSTLDSMLRFYRGEDRDIWRQRLPLTGDAARALEAKLWSDIEEAHRYYYYDHFFDNCATRLRDMLDEASRGALHAGAEVPYPQTFRELGRHGLAGMPSLLVATDLVTGRQIDEHPTLWQAMFLPAVLRTEVAVRLRAPPELIYHRRGPAFPVRGPSGRIDFLAISLVFSLPLFLSRWRRRLERAALVWAAIGLGSLGAVLWGLSIASPILAVRYNEALLVAVPLDAALPVLGVDWRRGYARARLIGLVVVIGLGVAGVFRQPLWTLVIAVALPLMTLAFDLPHGRPVQGQAGQAAE